MRGPVALTTAQLMPALGATQIAHRAPVCHLNSAAPRITVYNYSITSSSCNRGGSVHVWLRVLLSVLRQSGLRTACAKRRSRGRRVWQLGGHAGRPNYRTRRLPWRFPVRFLRTGTHCIQDCLRRPGDCLANLQDRTFRDERIIHRCRLSNGGEGEIRTHGARKGTPVFKTGALNRSATSPNIPTILAESSIKFVLN